MKKFKAHWICSVVKDADVDVVEVIAEAIVVTDAMKVAAIAINTYPNIKQTAAKFDFAAVCFMHIL